MNEPTAVENTVIQCLTGIVVGACAMLAVGFVKRAIVEHQTQSRRAP